MPRIEDSSDPELAALAKRAEETYARACALHEACQGCGEDEKTELRQASREAWKENKRASDAWREAHYARGDFSIPVPE